MAKAVQKDAFRKSGFSGNNRGYIPSQNGSQGGTSHQQNDGASSSGRGYRNFDQNPIKNDRDSSSSPEPERKPRHEVQDAGNVRMNAFRFNLTKAEAKIYTYELIFVMYQKKRLLRKPENYKPRTNAKALHPDEDLSLGYLSADEEEDGVDEEGKKAYFHGTDISHGPMDAVRKQKRRACVFSLFRHLVSTKSKVFPGSKYDYAFDAVRTLYTPRELESDISQDLEVANLPADVVDFLDLNAQTDSVMAFLRRRAEDIDLREFGTETNPIHGVEGFLETITWQHAYEKMNEHVVYGDRNFAIDAAKKLKHGKGLKTVIGFEKRIELVPDYDAEQSLLDRSVLPIMRMTPKFELFYDLDDGLTLYDFAICRFCADKPRDITRKLQKETYLRELNQLLKNAIVRTNHRDDGHQDIFMVDHIDERNAHEIDVNDEETVAEYLTRRYGHRADWDYESPCVARKFRGQFAYYPLCALDLLPNQKVTSRFLPPGVQRTFQEACQNLPAHAIKNISRALNELHLTKASAEYHSVDSSTVHINNPYLDSFKITIESIFMIEVPQHRIEEPVVAHTFTAYNAEGGNWAHDKLAKFVCPGIADSKIGIVYTGEKTKDDIDAQIGQFIKKITGWIQSRGVDINTRAGNLDNRFVTFGSEYKGYRKFGHGFKVSEMLAEAEHLIDTFDLRHVIIICNKPDPSKVDHTHDVWKLAELTNAKSQTGKRLVTTQFLTTKTLADVNVQHSNHKDKITSSFIMKMNLKLGGTNYVLQPHGSARASVGRGGRPNVMTFPTLQSTSMFVGVDVRQPETNLLNGEPSFHPTVCGFAYTNENPNFKLTGRYWYQRAKEIDLRTLQANFQDALARYGRNLPLYIYVYWRTNRRVKEDMRSEKIALQDVIDKVTFERNQTRGETPQSAPKLIIVSVNTKPNTRFFKYDCNCDLTLDGNAQAQNITAGFYVRESFLNNQFTMVSHSSSAGLALPVQFTVHSNSLTNAELCELEIEKTTNALSFLQNTSQHATSVPTPLYSAVELSKRGMNNYKILDASNRENETAKDRQKMRNNSNETWQKYYDLLLRDVMPVHAHEGKFWA